MSLIQMFVVIPNREYEDPRGVFFESFNERRVQMLGIEERFVQDNVSISRKGVLRGLHLQLPRSQGKLVQVLQGRVSDVVLDCRPESPLFGKWDIIPLDAKERTQVYIPPGYAHGFVAHEDETIFAYKVTEFYSPQDEVTIRFDDPDLGILWPVREPCVSEKDRMGISWQKFKAGYGL